MTTFSSLSDWEKQTEGMVWEVGMVGFPWGAEWQSTGSVRVVGGGWKLLAAVAAPWRLALDCGEAWCYKPTAAGGTLTVMNCCARRLLCLADTLLWV